MIFPVKGNYEFDIDYSKTAAPFYHRVRIFLYRTLQELKEQLIMVVFSLNLSCDSV